MGLLSKACTFYACLKDNQNLSAEKDEHLDNMRTGLPQEVRQDADGIASLAGYNVCE